MLSLNGRCEAGRTYIVRAVVVAVLAGCGVALSAAGAQPEQDAAAGSQSGEQTGLETFEDGALDGAAGQVEQRDLQVDAPVLGPDVRISAPLGTAGVSAARGDTRVSGGIPIPATARMPGDVRYVEVPVPVRVYETGVPDGDRIYYDDGLFIRGFVTDLHGRDRDRRRGDRGRRVSEPIRGGLLPSDPVFRRAHLRFSEAATAGNEGVRRSNDAFRRAQMRFHEASTRPHVDEGVGARRDSDRRHDADRRGDRDRGDRARDRRGSERGERRAPRGGRERPRRVGDGVIAPQ